MQNPGEISKTKTYVRGAFLYSTLDGTGFEEKNRSRNEEEVVIEDKGNMAGFKKEIMEKKEELVKKKEKTKKDKGMLIPIRDTPVQPLPQPSLQNNKCQRATQEQFEYFQTFISQKQKQRKFQEEERRRIEEFEREQERKRNKDLMEEKKRIQLVFEKQEEQISRKTSKKKGIKVVIKKKDQYPTCKQQSESQTKQKIQSKQKNVQNSDKKEQGDEDFQTIRKVRVVE